MKAITLVFVIILVFITSFVGGQGRFTLVVHGGAGNVTRERIGPEREGEFEAALAQALKAGEEILKNGGSSLEAVVAAVVVLENSPLFNAGRGAVFTRDGRNELDASIMDGSTLRAGAIAGVTNVKNPIKAALAVMENSPHVLLSGRGAEQFAFEQGLEIVDPSYFFDQHRWDQYREFLRATSPLRGNLPDDITMGTVGAVALDMHGNLAAATSTGGMTGKMQGRIGDSPIIGAGTYANNLTVAVSSTGHGEFFKRNLVAYDISARMAYLGETVAEATHYNIMVRLKNQGANGGVIAVDRNGNIAMPFNTTGMFRGYIKSTGESDIKIFK